jgi:hypothetical protein
MYGPDSRGRSLVQQVTRSRERLGSWRVTRSWTSISAIEFRYNHGLPVMPGGAPGMTPARVGP